jgi:hypothetical protein
MSTTQKGGEIMNAMPGPFRFLSIPIDFGDTDGDPIPGPGNGRKLTLPVTLIQDKIGGLVVTLATGIPSKIMIHGSGVRLVIWELDHGTIGNATYDFEPENGILVVKEKGAQLPRNERRRDTSTRFRCLHLNNAPDSEAIYFPIIRQTIGSEVSLCAAADPRIVNDP